MFALNFRKRRAHQVLGGSMKFAEWLAWKLPRKVVYWAAIRLMAHATQGQYSSTIVPELTVMDALQRWGGEFNTECATIA